MVLLPRYTKWGVLLLFNIDNDLDIVYRACDVFQTLVCPWNVLFDWRFLLQDSPILLNDDVWIFYVCCSLLDFPYILLIWPLLLHKILWRTYFYMMLSFFSLLLLLATYVTCSLRAHYLYITCSLRVHYVCILPVINLTFTDYIMLSSKHNWYIFLSNDVVLNYCLYCLMIFW